MFLSISINIVNTNYDININRAVFLFLVPMRLFSLTPHPHQDSNGTMYNVAVSLAKGTKYHFLETPSDPPTPGSEGKHPLRGTKIVATFEPKNKLCYYHSFAITPKYFVFIENPFVVDVWRLLTMKVQGKHFEAIGRRLART